MKGALRPHPPVGVNRFESDVVQSKLLDSLGGNLGYLRGVVQWVLLRQLSQQLEGRLALDSVYGVRPLQGRYYTGAVMGSGLIRAAIPYNIAATELPRGDISPGTLG